jgi:hypothetical protein
VQYERILPIEAITGLWHVAAKERVMPALIVFVTVAALVALYGVTIWIDARSQSPHS